MTPKIGKRILARLRLPRLRSDAPRPGIPRSDILSSDILSSARAALRRVATSVATSVATLAFLLAVGLQLATAPALAAPPDPGAVPAATPVVDPSPGGSGAAPVSLIPDPKVWASEVFTSVLTNMLGAMGEPIRLVVAGVVDGSLNFISATPPAGSYGSSTVQTLWGLTRSIANAALVLVVLWAGYGIVASEQLASPYHEALDVLPRIAVGALLANTSLTWAGLVIDANNALCQAVGGATFPAWDTAGGLGQQLIEAVVGIVYFVVGLLFILQMLMRLALVDVLLVVSPLALLCWVLPQTQQWAKLWSHTFFATVFTQFVQVLALRLGTALIGDASIPGASGVLLKLLLAVAVIVLTMRIPSLMRAYVGGGVGFGRGYVFGRGGGGRSGGAGRTGGQASGAGGSGQAAASGAAKLVAR